MSQLNQPISDIVKAIQEGGIHVSIWDENIDGAQFPYDGRITFEGFNLVLSFFSTEWPYGSKCHNYGELKPPEGVAVLEELRGKVLYKHQVSYGSLHYVVRSTQCEFTFVGLRQDFHIKVKEQYADA